MASYLNPFTLGHRTYEARRFNAPALLPTGNWSIDLAGFFLNIARGQDPNIPGFSPSALVPGYSLWPYLKYSALFVPTNEFRLIEEVRETDGRKKGLVAEDLGVGFALDACDALGALPILTKWEAAQEPRRAAWAHDMAIRYGIHEREAAEVSARLGSSLAGADFVGYSSTEGAWLVCESKGSLSKPPTAESVDCDLRFPHRDLGLTRNDKPVEPRTVLKGIRQKLETSQAASDAGAPVVSLLVSTSTATKSDRRMTTVDYIDPPAPKDLVALLTEYGELVGDFIAAAHYAWVAAVLGLRGTLWGSDGPEAPRLQILPDAVSVTYARVARLELAPDVTASVLIGLSPDVVETLRRRDLESLRAWSLDRGAFRSDGLLVRLIADDEPPGSLARRTWSGRGPGRNPAAVAPSRRVPA